MSTTLSLHEWLTGPAAQLQLKNDCSLVPQPNPAALSAAPQLKPVLLGNSFPMPLVYRPLHITPRKVEDLQRLLKSHPVRSFWGHGNTVTVASSLVGTDLTPRSQRPALRVDTEGYPVLDGESFEEVWVLSPVLPAGYRSPEWEVVPSHVIKGWKVLQLSFSLPA
jgi:hypothetical protein